MVPARTMILLVQFLKIYETVNRCLRVVPAISIFTVLLGCRFCYRVWILLQGVDSLTGCGFSYRVRILLQGVDSLTGCGFCYRVWILLQGVDSLTGWGFSYRVWILLQGVEETYHFELFSFLQVFELGVWASSLSLHLSLNLGQESLFVRPKIERKN